MRVWVSWALLPWVRAYELIETNYGDECTRLSYTCPEFEVCCTNRTRYSSKTRYNCLDAMEGRLMIYECVGSIRRRKTVPESLAAACSHATDYSDTCIRQAFSCWDFNNCCRRRAGIGAQLYCSELRKDMIDDFLCCSGSSGAYASPAPRPAHGVGLPLLSIAASSALSWRRLCSFP